MIDKIAKPSFFYLLRLWAESDGDEWVWRASLEHISAKGPDRQELKFSTPEAATSYLKHMIDDCSSHRASKP
ncbi:MAG: hypothetical protein ACI85U_004338 [Candidatus Promineifilaceae bacterium]|jgi:hypothetical protein